MAIYNAVKAYLHTGKECLVDNLHQEGLARMFLHVLAMTQDGHKGITIRTVDSDVVVLAITAFAKTEELEELWIVYGNGRSFCHIPVHTIVSHIGVVNASSLGAFL